MFVRRGCRKTYRVGKSQADCSLAANALLKEVKTADLRKISHVRTKTVCWGKSAKKKRGRERERERNVWVQAFISCYFNLLPLEIKAVNGK